MVVIVTEAERKVLRKRAWAFIQSQAAYRLLPRRYREMECDQLVEVAIRELVKSPKVE